LFHTASTILSQTTSIKAEFLVKYMILLYLQETFRSEAYGLNESYFWTGLYSRTGIFRQRFEFNNV